MYDAKNFICRMSSEAKKFPVSLPGTKFWKLECEYPKNGNTFNLFFVLIINFIIN